MKKFIFVTASLMAVISFISIAISSCRKDISGGGSSNSTSYYMRFKANGILTEYTGSAVATFANYTPGLYTCALVGSRIEGSSTDGLGITLNDTIPISTGIIYADEVLPGFGTPQTTFQYVDSLNTTYLSVYVTSPLTPHVQVIFTEITSTYVRGTFAGNTQVLAAPDTVIITEGEFFFKRL